MQKLLKARKQVLEMAKGQAQRRRAKNFLAAKVGVDVLSRGLEVLLNSSLSC